MGKKESPYFFHQIDIEPDIGEMYLNFSKLALATLAVNSVTGAPSSISARTPPEGRIGYSIKTGFFFSPDYTCCANISYPDG